LITSFFEVKLEDDPLLAGGNDYAANCDGGDDNASSNDHEDEDGSELFDETANQVTYLLPSLLYKDIHTFVVHLIRRDPWFFSFIAVTQFAEIDPDPDPAF
jgi:hypothetical protein